MTFYFILSTFISWFCPTAKSLVLFVYYHRGFVNSDFIQFSAHTVQDLASGNSFWPAPVSSHVSSLLSEDILIPFVQDVVSSACTFLSPALESATSLKV